MNAQVENLSGTVQYVNEPKPGRKKGSLKFDDGTYVSLWPSELDEFVGSEGQEITIPVSRSTSQDGTVFLHFENPTGGSRPRAGGARKASNFNGGGASASASAAPAGGGGSDRAIVIAACIRAGVPIGEVSPWLDLAKGIAPPAAVAPPAPVAVLTSPPDQTPGQLAAVSRFATSAAAAQAPLDDEVPF